MQRERITKMKFPVIEWYTELQEIRERLSTEDYHLNKIENFKGQAFTSASEMSNRDLIEMFHMLLLSYPVLARRHYNVWDECRNIVENIVKGDEGRCRLFLEACVIPVVDDYELESLKNLHHSDRHEFFAPFDYMDIVTTLKDNKGRMPFHLIHYDNKRLALVVKNIKKLDISEIIRFWINGYPSKVYPEVYELYKTHSKDSTPPSRRDN